MEIFLLNQIPAGARAAGRPAGAPKMHRDGAGWWQISSGEPHFSTGEPTSAPGRQRFGGLGRPPPLGDAQEAARARPGSPNGTSLVHRQLPSCMTKVPSCIFRSLRCVLVPSGAGLSRRAGFLRGECRPPATTSAPAGGARPPAGRPAQYGPNTAVLGKNGKSHEGLFSRYFPFDKNRGVFWGFPSSGAPQNP